MKAGTTKFLPPEVASGSTYSSSPKLDSWALGVLLYLMLFGQYPFDSNKESEIVTKIIKEEHKIPNNIVVSKAAINLLNGLLDKYQKYRIDTFDALFDDWYNDEYVFIYKLDRVKINQYLKKKKKNLNQKKM